MDLGQTELAKRLSRISGGQSIRCLYHITDEAAPSPC